MTKKQERIKAAREKAERDALNAAYAVFTPLKRRLNQEAEVEVSKYLKHVLLALKAVSSVRAAAEKAAEDDDDEFVYLDAFHIVATALNVATGAGWEGLHDDEVHPYSVGAAPMLGFAKACLILEASANYHLAVDEPDGGFISEGYVDEALEAVTKADEEARAREKASHDPR